MASAARQKGPVGSGDLIDTNVNLSRWPLRRLAFDDTAALASMLRGQGVSQAWAGSYDGMLHKDLAEVNSRLADQCRRHGRGMLLPFGTINPRLPDWEEELRRCHDVHEMRGVRLYPNYHGYALDVPGFARLLDLATEARLIVQIPLSMEDERMQPALMRAPPVDPAPLADLLKTRKNLKIVLLNWFRELKGDLLTKLAESGRVFFDISSVEGVGGVENLLKQVPAQSILFGSQAPYFYFESAVLKLKESALSDSDLAQVRTGNARSLLA